jgi:hypothetical protein
MDVKDTKDRGLKNIIIDEETYKNLYNMLASTDEDKVIALTCINNLDKKANLVPTLFLRKEISAAGLDMWKQHCPSVVKYHGSLQVNPDNNVIKFKDILRAIKQQGEQKEASYKFFSKRFEDFVKSNLIGFDFIENVELKIKIKND